MSSDDQTLVVTGEENIRAVAKFARLQVYRMWGQIGLTVNRGWTPTVKGFNAEYGLACRTRADVGREADRLIKAHQADRSKTS